MTEFQAQEIVRALQSIAATLKRIEELIERSDR